MDIGIPENIMKVMTFNGAEGEWREWSAKFLARARLNGYIGALMGTSVTPPLDKC